MNKYLIYEATMGILSRTKHSVSDKYGNKRKHLVYWANSKGNETIRFFYLSAILQKIMIRMFTNDLNPIIVKIKYNDVKGEKDE